MKTRLSIVAILFVLSAAANAEPYWIAYEGNDFPENEGWGRVTSGGGAQRSIVDGILVLDGLADVRINDVYNMGRQLLDPEPGEYFHAEWRFALDALVGLRDPGFAVFSDESWAVGFSFSTNAIRSGFEGIDIPFKFTGMREFALASQDMRSYELHVDGALLSRGQFVQVASASVVSWGDGIQGAASLSRWDYVRFGVVPEPGSLLLLCASIFVTGVIPKVRRVGNGQRCSGTAVGCSPPYAERNL